jgi:formylglycine-generating enzyme required for sulfatase activity
LLNKQQIKSISTFKLLLLSSAVASTVVAQEYIVPPMVNIPAGSFMMGMADGSPDSRPVHSESVAAFQVGKYAVTVAEFRKFAEETGFNPESTCGDKLDSTGLGGPTDLGTGRWDKHRYSNSEYQPVTCVNWQDANAYADWLSNKTGRAYRLPTEQEWEYAARAKTTSHYYWGNDLDMTQACSYGNFADKTGEYINNETYGLSNIGWIDYGKCDDGEAYIAIVGLYRPNPFGLYDILGNASEFINTCYYENGYKVRSKEEMDVDKCEFIGQRGSGWHYPARPIAHRGGYKREGWNRLSSMSFRLVTVGHKSDLDVSTIEFEKKLKQAQIKRLATRPNIPSEPKNVQLIETKGVKGEKIHQLSWQPSSDKRVIGYDIYQAKSRLAHLYGGYYKNHYKKVESVIAPEHSVIVDLPSDESSFRVVSKTNSQNSLPSQPITALIEPNEVTLPGKIHMDDIAELKNIHLRKSSKEDNPTPFYIFRMNKISDRDLVTSTFNINVEKSSWYYLNYQGRSFDKGLFFKLWQNNTFLADIAYDPDIDDKMSNRHQVFLEKGTHQLQLSVLREGFDMWSITWLEFTEVKQ